jgi:hypothetical protein
VYESKCMHLQTSFEDVFPVEATSVEEYLQQVRYFITFLRSFQFFLFTFALNLSTFNNHHLWKCNRRFTQ